MQTQTHASSCTFHVTNPGKQLWNMHQWWAKSIIIYILQPEVISLEQPQRDIAMCVCACLWIYVCECALRGVLAATAHQCDHTDMLLWALSLDSRVCSVTSPTHACLAGLAALPQAAHPFISIFLTPADKSNHCALILPVSALLNIFAFPRKLVKEKNNTKRHLACHPRAGQ